MLSGKNVYLMYNFYVNIYSFSFVNESYKIDRNPIGDFYEFFTHEFQIIIITRRTRKLSFMYILT